MTMAAGAIFFSGSYFSPAITMMQNSVDKKNSGNIVGAYLFIATILASTSPILFDYFANIMNASKNPSVYGYLITIFVSFGYLVSSVFYYKSGLEYTKLVN